jgi:sulfate transport system permease protein
MSGAVSIAPRPLPGRRRRAQLAEGWLARLLLIAAALAFLSVFLLGPLLTVFVSAFSKGIGPYWAALVTDDTLAAIELTFLTAAISVPLNTVFGIAAAWLIAKYEFPGKSIVLTLIDLPFSVSPVISGLIFVLLFGAHGVLGPYLQAHDIRVVFAVPGIILATTFVTFPLVAREVLAVMQAQGSDEEEAALTLGASGLQILYLVTLRKVRWGLLYGVILCNARAMGEFGAVSVVSGHIRGETNTMPLHIEILYNEYNFVGAFAVASLLALLALATLVVKKSAEWMSSRSRQAADRDETAGVGPAGTGAAELGFRRAL